MSLIMSSIIGESSGGSSACIDISTRPNRLNYKEGERLDLTGMVVELYEKGKEPVRIEGYDTIPSDGAVLTKNDDVIIIKYKKDGALFKTILPIDIIYPVGIEVVDYEDLGNTFNLDGIKINVVYNDASKELVSDKTQLVTDPTNGQYIENNRIKIRYKDLPEIVYNTKAINEHGNSALMYQNYLCTFARGSKSQIAEMIKLSRMGLFNMTDFWKVGDERDNILDGTVSDNFSYISSTKRSILKNTPNWNVNSDNKYYYSALCGNIKFVILDFNKTIQGTLYDVIVGNKNVMSVKAKYTDLVYTALVDSTTEYQYGNTRAKDQVYAFFAARSYNSSAIVPQQELLFNKIIPAVPVDINTYNLPKLKCHKFIAKIASHQTDYINSESRSSGSDRYYTYHDKITVQFIDEDINTSDYGSADLYINYTEDLIIGPNCFKYYKISSNRIKLDEIGKPSKWYIYSNPVEHEYTCTINSTYVYSGRKRDSDSYSYSPGTFTVLENGDTIDDVVYPRMFVKYVDERGEIQKTYIYKCPDDIALACWFTLV